MTDDDLLGLLTSTVDSVAAALTALGDWGPSGERVGQYRSDLIADAAAARVLGAAGVSVLSEESGVVEVEDAAITVVIDPLDGSTNAHRGIPWYAVSVCAVDADGARVAIVADLVSGARFVGVRGGGATVDGRPLVPSSVTDLGEACIGLSGWPPRHLGWRQFRALGAVALDLCAVASGVLDGYVDCSHDAHGVWDYAGAVLICREAGVNVVDAHDRELMVLDVAARRTPVAGATPALLAALVAARSRGVGESTPQT